MRHVTNVAGRELRGLFASPVAYAILSLFAVITGVVFVLTTAGFQEWIFRLQQYQAFDQLAQLNLNDHLIALLFDTMNVFLLFATPAITMGLFAAERANGTQELLLTSPLTTWDIVLGKLLAGWIFMALLVAIVGMYPAILFAYGDPEFGKTLAGLLGLLLVGWMYVSIGAFASSVTQSQVIAFFLALILLVILLFLQPVAELGVASAEGMREVLRYLTPSAHFQQLVKGLVDTSDLVYFAATIVSFAVLTKASLESARWR